MKDTCEYPSFIGHRIQDNIVFIELKKIKKMTAQDVSEIFECFQKCGNEYGVYVLVTFKGYIPLSDEAMEEAQKEENRRIVKATAFVIKSTALRLGIKFFMNFYKPKQSINIFGTKEEAIIWLKKEKILQTTK